MGHMRMILQGIAKMDAFRLTLLILEFLNVCLCVKRRDFMLMSDLIIPVFPDVIKVKQQNIDNLIKNNVLVYVLTILIHSQILT